MLQEQHAIAVNTQSALCVKKNHWSNVAYTVGACIIIHNE